MPEAGAKSPAAPPPPLPDKPDNNNEDDRHHQPHHQPHHHDRNAGGAPVPPAHVSIPLINENQLTAATGGAELSCYRCTVPFGVVVLIAGVVVTAVAYSFNSHGSTISYLGLVLLSAGLLLLASSAVCWKVRLERRKERRRESQTTLVAPRRGMFGERLPPHQPR